MAFLRHAQCRAQRWLSHKELVIWLSAVLTLGNFYYIVDFCYFWRWDSFQSSNCFNFYVPSLSIVEKAFFAALFFALLLHVVHLQPVCFRPNIFCIIYPVLCVYQVNTTSPSKTRYQASAYVHTSNHVQSQSHGMYLYAIEELEQGLSYI